MFDNENPRKTAGIYNHKAINHQTSD